MNASRWIRRMLALAGTMILSTSAQAQLFRAYVASDGNDANSCTLPAPCRLLPAALAAIANGGQIWMLDSANYNSSTVNINKSVSILAVPGAVGSIVTNGGDAISIATPGVKVALRNVVVGPVVGAIGGFGIYMTAGDALTVEDSLFANLDGAAISVNAAAVVQITDTTVRDNVGHGLILQGGARGNVARSTFAKNGPYAVYALGSGDNATTLDINRSNFFLNESAIIAYSSHASGIVAVSVGESQLASNLVFGAIAQSNAGAAVTLIASNNVITGNGSVGLGSYSAGALVSASGNTVSGNTYGFYKNPTGAFESLGNNTVRNNGLGNTFGIIGSALLQ